MSEKELDRQAVSRIYNLLGSRYDWLDSLGGRARPLAIRRMELKPGLSVVDVGAGSGRSLNQIKQAVAPDDLVCGLDVAEKMLLSARRKTSMPLVLGEAGRLPFMQDCFDRLICCYTLDLAPHADLGGWLSEFRRVLRPGGQMALVYLTRGVNRWSRMVVTAWERLYAIAPTACGGCRPLDLTDLIQTSGFEMLTQEVILEFGVPSAVVTARWGT